MSNADIKILYFTNCTNFADNRLIRPAKNHSEKLTVNISLKLTQIIDIVSMKVNIQLNYINLIFFSKSEYETASYDNKHLVEASTN